MGYYHPNSRIPITIAAGLDPILYFPMTTSAPPPVRPDTLGEWLRNNLFSNWFSSLLTLGISAIVVWLGSGLWTWATTIARWDVLPANLPLYFAGRFPQAEYWRLWIILSIVTLLAGASWGQSWEKARQTPTPGRSLSTWAVSPGLLVGLGLGIGVNFLSASSGDLGQRMMIWALVAIGLCGVFVGRSLCPWFKSLSQWSLIGLWILPGLVVVGLGGDLRWVSFVGSFLLGVTWVWFRPRLPHWIGLLTLVGLGISGLITVLPPVPLPYRGALTGEILLFLGGVFLGGWVARLPGNLGRWLPLLWFSSFGLGLWLLRGGFGLAIVSTNDWSGLLLTVFLSIVSIAFCFPLGVLLALGRQSELPALRWLSTLHIEVIRGVPLIAILFMGQVMIPLFLPEGMRPDRVLRAIVGLTIFSAVYMAENIRGGLQSIPKGQIVAANALGLNAPLTLAFVVLPQALKVSIPAIIGQFISLLQDTTLLSIVGLLELLGLSRAILANPQFVGRNAETYLFIGVLYWFFCYAMSLGGRQLEKSLNQEHR